MIITKDQLVHKIVEHNSFGPEGFRDEIYFFDLTPEDRLKFANTRDRTIYTDWFI